jgi:putative ABC transport system permease protein
MLRALWRQKVGAVLIALQIALTLSIMVNAIFMMQQRSQEMARASGLDEANLFYLTNTVFGDNYPYKASVEADLRLIRSVPGVVDAVQINAIPMSGSGWSMVLQLKPGAGEDVTGSAIYMVDEHGLNTLGVELIRGENFQSTDLLWRSSGSDEWPAKVLISKALAESLFPDNWETALGKTVYINEQQPMQVSGIIKTLQAPWNGWNGVERSMLVPMQLENRNSRYLIRTEPGRRDELMPVIEQALAKADKNRIIRNLTSLAQTRQESYRSHQALNKILLFVIVLLTLITAFGIVGLAMFSINRRKKQIGTRRALGATQFQVMRYFMLENLLISTLGIVVGMAAAIGLNIWLVSKFQLTPLGPGLLLTAALVLYLVGQLAVFYPARKAAAIAPATATRSV